jgi:hypothetical protein
MLEEQIGRPHPKGRLRVKMYPFVDDNGFHFTFGFLGLPTVLNNFLNNDLILAIACTIEFASFPCNFRGRVFGIVFDLFDLLSEKVYGKCRRERRVLVTVELSKFYTLNHEIGSLNLHQCLQRIGTEIIETVVFEVKRNFCSAAERVATWVRINLKRTIIRGRAEDVLWGIWVLSCSRRNRCDVDSVSYQEAIQK